MLDGLHCGSGRPIGIKGQGAGSRPVRVSILGTATVNPHTYRKYATGSDFTLGFWRHRHAVRLTGLGPKKEPAARDGRMR